MAGDAIRRFRLPGGHRWRRWVGPALIPVSVVVALAVLVGLVLRWWAGLIVLGAAAAMVLTVRPHMAPERHKEAKAHQLTSRLLGRLRGKGHRVLRERAIPGSDEVVEHLVVGPTGVFLVASEKWDRFTPVRVAGRELYSGPSSSRHVLLGTARTAQRAGELIGRATGGPVEVVPTLVIHGPKVPWTVLSLHGVHVLSSRRLNRYLRRGRRRLTRVEVERITSAADAVLPPRP